MTLNRTIHNKNYITINNTICKDNRLSWKAKGIWLYAFHRPDDWTFYQSEMMKHAKDGEDSFQSGIQELIACGYLIRAKTRDKLGKYTYEYQWFETPQSVEIQKNSPEPGFPPLDNPPLDNPPVDNPPLTNTDSPILDLNEKQQQQTNPVVVVSSEEEKEKRKLIEEFYFDEQTLQHLLNFPLKNFKTALELLKLEERTNPPGFIRMAIEKNWQLPVKEESAEEKKEKKIKMSQEVRQKCVDLIEKYRPYIKFKGILDINACLDYVEIRPYNGSVMLIPYFEENCYQYLQNHVNNCMKIINEKKNANT